MARVLVLLTLAVILGSVAAAPVPKSGPKPPWKFPTQVGTEWVYDYSGDEDAQVTEAITKGEEKDGIRTIKIRSESERVANGMKMKVIDAKTLWVSNEGWSEGRSKPTFQLLKLPHKIGDAWEQKHTNLAFSRTANQVVAEEKIKVPAGTFDCVQVETKAYDGEKLEWTETNWYASGVGLVKSTGGPIEKRVQVLKKFTLGKD